MEWVNVHYAIYSKTGTQIVAPTPGNTLFMGTSFCGSHNNGDPIVLSTSSRGPLDGFAVRVEQQIRARFLPVHRGLGYTTRPGPGAPTSSSCYQTKFNDYPKFGIWPSQNSYTMTACPLFPDQRGRHEPGHLRLRTRQDASPAIPPHFVFQDMIGLARGRIAAHPAGRRRRLRLRRRTNAPEPNRHSATNDGAGFRAADEIDQDVWNATIDLDKARPRSTSSTRASHTGSVVRPEHRLRGWSQCVQRPGRRHGRRSPTASCSGSQYRNFGGRPGARASHTVDADGTDRAGVRWYELRKRTDGLGASTIRARSRPTTASTAGWAAPRWTMTATSRSATRFETGDVYPGLAYAGRLDPTRRTRSARARRRCK